MPVTEVRAERASKDDGPQRLGRFTPGAASGRHCERSEATQRSMQAAPGLLRRFASRNDEFSRSRSAPAPCSFHALNGFASDGSERHFFAPFKRGRRSAERRTKVQGSRTRKTARPDWPRSCKRTARLPALHRGHAPGTLHPQLGPGRASWNHRIQTGGPSPAPVQRAPRSPVTRRTGRCPSRLRAKSDELRPQEPHPLRQSASPVDVPHDERDGRLYSNNKHVVKAFLIYSNKSRGYAI